MKINRSKIFDWSVVGAQTPYPIKHSDAVFAYVADVMYRHHGVYRAVFPIERDRVYVTGCNLALSQAQSFADIMFAKMRRDSKVK